MRHHTPRQPRGRHFAWSRVISHNGEVVTYRLFRRDHNGKVHQCQLQYLPIGSRTMIAGDLKRVRKVLRDRVDEIDLAAMEAA